MQNKKQFEINIIKIQKSQKLDNSSYHLAHITFDINNKQFEIDEYIDPIYNALVTRHIEPTQSVVGNDKASLFIEMTVKLHLTDDECKMLFTSIVRKINALIDKSAELRRTFPPLIDLIFIGQSMGFACLKMTPEYHFSKTEWNGREQHIRTHSIKMLVNELDQYATDEYVMESYTYHELAKQCFGYPDFFIAVNNLGNGWLVYWWGKEPNQYLSRKVDMLRELAIEINFRKANSPFN